MLRSLQILEERRLMMKNNRLIAIDLFCGCGGFSYGFQDAGFDVALGIDMWKDATITYKNNFPNAKVINDDITKVNGKDILHILKLNNDDIDVIIGGPPCQGFSVSGKRMLDDPRNNLYKSFVEIVQEIKPKVFIMENVPGLIRLFGGKVKEEVLEDFSSLGYEVKVQLLSSDAYGVPQQRKRVFFVGINKEKISNTKEFSFPEATNGIGLEPVVTCKEAISDLDFVPDDKSLGEDINYKVDAQCEYQKIMRNESSSIKNHSITIHKEKTKEIISMVPDGGNYKNLPIELQSTRKVNIAWTRMNSQKPCFTIDTGHNHHFHYKENRVPTVRESARIQSFPDKFKFVGIKTSQLKQVGNAVPPLMAGAIAREVKKIIERG
jgi:DNA (cytosine-5)-methyltransferase 1